MPRRATSTSFGGKRGNPRGTKPGPGRPPKTFVARLQSILERQKTVENIEAILDDPGHPQFAKILDYATERAHGKVPNENKHEGEITVRVVRDE